MAVPTVLGQDTTVRRAGVLHFAIDGVEHSLEPFLSGPENESYFLIFRDATSAVTTYGAGRFLYASAAGEDGTDRPRFQPCLQPTLRVHPLCHLSPAAAAELAPGCDRSRREVQRRGTLIGMKRWSRGPVNWRNCAKLSGHAALVVHRIDNLLLLFSFF